MKDYSIVTEGLKDYKRVEIQKETIDKISDLIPKIVKEKMKERDHKIDCGSEYKRWRTGLYGEAGVEQLLGIPVIDWEVGETAEFSRPDLPGYNVGVKTIEYGYFPIISKRNKYPQIICIKFGNVVYVCGLATVEVLNEFQDDDLIFSDSLRRKGYKTGFYGFDKLIPIHNISDLEEYKI